MGRLYKLQSAFKTFESGFLFFGKPEAASRCDASFTTRERGEEICSGLHFTRGCDIAEK